MRGFRGRLTLLLGALTVVAVACPPQPDPDPTDTTPPVLVLPAPITQPATSELGAEVSFAALATDAVDGAVEVACSPDSGSTFPVGITTVACTAADTAGNVATGSFTVTIADTTAPTLTLGGDLTVEATTAAGAEATYAASATDASDPAPSLLCEPPSGSVFPVGVTTVSCTATDAAGNTAEGAFNVTVTDTTGPALSLPDGVSAEATGPSGASATWTTSASDLVDGTVAVSCDADPGPFPLGSTVVACSAVDSAGNTTSGSFTVTVADTTGPALDLPDDISTPATDGDGATVTFSATANDLVDGTVAVTCSPASGTTFATGSTTVTCTASDGAGNESTDTFSVTVTTGGDWITPGCYPSSLFDGSIYYSGPENTVNNTQVYSSHTDGPCTGPSFPLTIIRADPNTQAQADLVCGALIPDNVGRSLAPTGLDLPADAWNCALLFIPSDDVTPPVVTLPGNQRVNATGPDGAVVSFDASAFDDVDGALPVTCVPPSGSLFPIGTTEVWCSAEDAAGNYLADYFSIEVSATPLWANGGCYASTTGGPDLQFNGYEDTVGNIGLRSSLDGSCAGSGVVWLSLVRVDPIDETEATERCQSLGHSGASYPAALSGWPDLPEDAYICEL